MLSDLRAFILEDDTIAGLISSRMYPVVLPQGVIFPALSYSQVSGVRLYDLCGPSGRVRPRISVNSWAQSYMESRALAEAVRHRIEGFRGIAGDSPGTKLDDVKLDNEFDIFESEGGTKGVHRVVQDYILSHLES